MARPPLGGAVDGRAHALAADEAGTVVVGDGREAPGSRAQIHQGAVRIRAVRIERHARDPQVFLQTAEDGRRLGIQVVAVRAIETGDRLGLWRFGPDALLRNVREIAASPAIELLSAAPDPWGGGVVGYAREETSPRVDPHRRRALRLLHPRLPVGRTRRATQAPHGRAGTSPRRALSMTPHDTRLRVVGRL